MWKKKRIKIPKYFSIKDLDTFFSFLLLSVVHFLGVNPMLDRCAKPLDSRTIDRQLSARRKKSSLHEKLRGMGHPYPRNGSD
jgi:hypothetical protein